MTLLSAIPVTDTIAYIFRFADTAQAQADTVIGPLMGLPNAPQEVLVFADVTIDSTTPLSGFWLRYLAKGGVDLVLFAHSNLVLCIDINRINTGASVLLATINTDHICIIVDNYDSFIQDGFGPGSFGGPFLTAVVQGPAAVVDPSNALLVEVTQ